MAGNLEAGLLECPFCDEKANTACALAIHIQWEHGDCWVDGRRLELVDHNTRVICWCGYWFMTNNTPFRLPDKHWANHLRENGGAAGHVLNLMLRPETQSRLPGKGE